MEENLVGYLLKAFDPDAHRQVETYLRDHPEARQRLDLLRRALGPLAADREDVEPPPGLALRTLARVAEYRCRELPRAPRVAPGRAAAPRTWWRRADVAVAASILVCATLLTLPIMNLVRDRHNRIACANNLRVIGRALNVYSDHHQTATSGAFPDVARPFADAAEDPEPAPKQSAAGMFMPVLLSAGLDQDDVSVRCPAVGSRQACGWTLDQLRHMSTEDFKRHASELAPDYAYTLGYQDHGQIRGLCRADGTVPIVADRPPVLDSVERAFGVGNSANHGGRGQNVLFTDGHVEWHTEHILDGDDFFVNNQHQIAAGLHRGDYVLGSSGSHP
jgi:prepilin-type processing-associated H-X9-DG protein